ncbi:MAG TPA: alpha/beta hydrolase [Solirubrobacteraceae bacterium]|nr:alpha/beta hydrolase [Solirubrobacteraceae bacterium]
MFPDVPPPLDGVQHTDVQVRRARWHVAIAGEDGAPPLVLLHGWPQHFYAWRHVIDRLRGEYRIYAPDLRGFGWSDAPGGAYSKMGLATDVVELLDRLELETCTLAGHDWGGLVGFLAALREPERVERLAAFSIIHPWVHLTPPTPGAVVRASYQYVLATPYVGELAQKVGGAALQALLRASSGSGFEWDDEALDLYAGAFRRGPHARAASALYRTFLLRELPQFVAGRYANRTLEVPGVLATGSGDPAVTPDRLANLERNAPNMTTEVLEGAGHWLPEERPDEVAALIRGS